MKLVWHGTASIEMVCTSGQILFDPYVPLKGSDVSVGVEEFDGFHDIFITHGHFDHISLLPTVVERNKNVRIHCTKTPYHTLVKKGIPKENLSMINYGQTIDCNGFSIHVLHGKHAVLPKASLWRIRYGLRSPARKNILFVLFENLRYREKKETVFYQITAEGKSISLMGSMNLHKDVAYPMNSDLLVLPYCGWENNYKSAVSVIEHLRPKKVLLDHFDDAIPPFTMPLDLNPILDKYQGKVSPMELRKEEFF